jgi:hypothetical protein
MRTLVAFAITLLALPVSAQDDGWPDASTDMLEVAAAGITVTVPAPPWIDRAVRDGTMSDGGIHAEWFIAGGFDARGSSLDVAIETRDDWAQGAQRHSYGYDASSCDTLALPKLPRIKGLFEWTVICGRDFGTNRGVIYYGQTRMVGDDHVVDVWYQTDVAPFSTHDAASWPMPEAEVVAMLERLRAAITVTGP